MSVRMTVILVLGIALALVLIVGLVLLIVFIAKQISGGRGGWVRLVEQYGTPHPPAGNVLAKQTVQIGSVIYRNCTTLGVADEGLYITTWKKTVLIPWSDFTGISQGRLYWERAPVLTVGQPVVATIMLPMRLYHSLRDHLPAGIRPPS